MLGIECFINVIDLPCPAVPSYWKPCLHARMFYIVIVLVVVARRFIIYPSGAFTIV